VGRAGRLLRPLAPAQGLVAAMRRSRGIWIVVALAAAAVALAAILAAPSGGRARDALQSCPGSFPPKRPEFVSFKVSGMACWAAKVLLDEAIEQRVGSKRSIRLLGFTCRFKPSTEASGVVSCSGHGAYARAAYSVF
jgi:hypothetical protein